jgi:hypothetical protein
MLGGHDLIVAGKGTLVWTSRAWPTATNVLPSWHFTSDAAITDTVIAGVVIVDTFSANMFCIELTTLP